MPRIAELRRTIFEAGEAARKIQLRHFGKLKHIDKKGAIDLLTVADRESEEAIIARIRRDFPDHGILAEESGADQAREAEYCWVIDPLDGTTNYAHGVPIWAISIALQRRGETVMGLVIDPGRDETYFARRGGGAFLNRRRIGVSGCRRLSEALLCTGFPYQRRENPGHFTDIIKGFLLESHGVLRLGAAAIDLCWIACGRFDGFWEENLHPWDVAAACLIIEEAGGRVTDFGGGPSSIYDNNIICSNGRIHGEIRRVLDATWAEWRAG